ncbi:MAG TPA: lysophospholipid acyltransferase family protein [Bacteroidales bacterium]|nr:lysophospholipid acyltransferase family protein [Bacteroidales bacterium]HPS63776.1 lysophospholipid acyltransferase family protein [Bacteroidales bacterium]
MATGTVNTHIRTPWSQVLVSCYFWFTLFFISALLFPFAILIWLITLPFDRRRYLLHQFTCGWSDIMLGINPYWTVKIRGREKIDPHKVYVMVANHSSGVDILVLFKLHRHFKWVAKKDLFRIPFIGWNMALNGYIPIERARGRSKLQMMDKAAAVIRQGNSVILFPEGTRTRDGRLQPYKSGAFRLAQETGTPVLPVVIGGTFHAIRKGGFLIHKNHSITLTILDPVATETVNSLDAKSLAQNIYNQTQAELERVVTTGVG